MSTQRGDIEGETPNNCRTLEKLQNKIIKREGEQDPDRLRMYHHIMDVIAAVILYKDALINSPESYFKYIYILHVLSLMLTKAAFI